jgi:glutathione S-transferase
MLKIWGRANSINVQKVMWCVEELGIAHSRVDAGMSFGVVNEPGYRAMNPNGRVPTIDDAGFVLWESNAIVRYLAAKHGAGTLWPESLQARADSDRWMDWCTSTLAAPMTALFWQLVRTPPEKRDAKAIEDTRAQCEALFGIVDERLADRPYLAGHHLTMGDIPVGCFACRWKALPMERPTLAHLDAYHARLAARPAFRRHVMLPLT